MFLKRPLCFLVNVVRLSVCLLSGVFAQRLILYVVVGRYLNTT